MQLRSIQLIITIVSALFLAAGCANEGSSPPTVTVSVTGTDGTLDAQSGTWDEVFWDGYTDLPPFVVDGHEATDPAEVLDATRAEFRMADGSTLVLERVDGVLRMAQGPELNVGSELTVSFGEGSMLVHGPDGDAEVHLEAANAAKTRSYLGRCAIDLLGGSAGLDGVETGRDLITIAVITGVVAVSLAYTTCITVGTAICLSEARRACSGSSSLRRAKMICGAGFDFDGRLQLGSHCAYECRSN